MLAIFPITEMGLPVSSSTKWEVMRIHFLSLSGFASSWHSTSVTAFDGEVNASSSSGFALCLMSWRAFSYET